MARRSVARRASGALWAFVMACLATAAFAAAPSPSLPDLAQILDRIQAEPAFDAAAALAPHLEALSTADVQRKREFAAAAAHKLPPKAADRLAQARAAYAAGHGRLLEILKALAAPPPVDGATPPADRASLAREAEAIVKKLQDASGAEPISATLSVNSPNLTAPGLNQPLGGSTQPQAVGAIPPAIQTMANGLAGPIEIYEAVRNGIRPDFYYGVMKGPSEALLEASANDADAASVLVMLLRAKGIPARYVRGTVKVSTSTLKDLTGTANATQAVRVFQRAGVPVDFDPSDLTSVKMERVWAEAYLPYTNYRGAVLDAQGKFWIPLDAAFKRFTPPTGMPGILTNLGIDPLALVDEYLTASRTDTPLQFTRARVTEQLAARFPAQTYAGVSNKRDFLAETLGILPSSLPYEVVHVTETSYDLPAPLVHQIHISGDATGVIDATLSVPDVLGKRLTLSYVPFSDEDAALAQSYGGLSRTPPYLIDVKAVVKSGGISVAAGSQPIGMGVRFVLRLELRSPGGTQTIEDKVTAGNLTVIGLGGSAVTGVETTTDKAAEVLSQLAWHYLDRWNTSDAELANLLRVVPVRPTVSLCLVMSAVKTEYAGGDPLYPLTFDWKGIAVDADRRVSAPVGVETQDSERSFLLLSGLEGSSLEQRLFEDDLHVDSISTNEVLGRARQQGQTVYDLTSGNVDAVLPTLPFDPQVLAEIHDAAYRGQRVTVPAGTVTKEAWTGVGYRLLDEATGEAAYQLQGGYSGGMTTVDPSQFPTDLKDPLARDGEDPDTSPASAVVTHIAAFPSTDLQEGTVDKPFARPLKVLVTNDDGYAVKGATVTFRTSPATGGGYFIDVVTGKQVPPLQDAAGVPIASEISVLSDERGEAAATLVAGVHTNVLPRFIQLEGQEFATQVGLNLVTVSCDKARLAQPFQEIAFPDYEEDPQQPGVFFVYMSLSHYEPPFAPRLDWQAAYNLRVPDSPTLAVNDQHGNPISNVLIEFSYDTVEVKDPNTLLSPSSGWFAARPPLDSPLPGTVLKLEDFVKCMQANGSVRRGECAGEAAAVIVNSSTRGAVAYPVLGDSPISMYYFHIGTDLHPNDFRIGYLTGGLACQAPSIDAAGCYAGPILRVYSGTRWFFGPEAQEAYPVGGSGDITLWSDVLWEESAVAVIPAHGNTPARYGVYGTNVWHRDRLSGSQFTLTPLTPGTTAAPDVPVEDSPGLYRSTMGISTTPAKNTVRYDGKYFPAEIPYLRDPLGNVTYDVFTVNGQPKDLLLVDPGAVTADLNVVRQTDPNHPWTGQYTFSLWGLDPRVTKVDPAPILLDGGSHVERDSIATVSIAPAEYKQYLKPQDVVFELLDREDKPVVVGNNDTETFTIPRPMALPEGTYEAQVRVVGVSSGGQEVKSNDGRIVVKACRLLDLKTSEVDFEIFSDPDDSSSATCWGAPKPVQFNLCRPATITVTADGSIIPLRAPFDGDGTPRTLDTTLGTLDGSHSFLLDPARPELDGDYIVTAVAADGSVTQQERLTIKRGASATFLPIGHTFVKGVDLFDGHVVQQATDLKIPGRNIGLEITRTYSSSGKRDEGAFGAGWAFNYGAALTTTDCQVFLNTADGTGVTFHKMPDGSYQPQKGYHGTLTLDPSDGTFTYVDKAGIRHHFGVANPNAPGQLLLDRIEEPHGDRIVVHHDDQGLVSQVGELQKGSTQEIRSLQFSYKKFFRYDRISAIDSDALALHMTYSYDDWGNLKTAVRRATNLPGNLTVSPDRSQAYEYTADQVLDPHNMTSATDPNGSKTEYQYYTASDNFHEPVLTTIDHTQYVGDVREIVDAAAHPPTVATTHFAYDLADFSVATGTTNPWVRTTVTDANQHDTKYSLNIHGSPLTIDAPLDRSTVLEWNTDEKVKVKETDALHRETEYKYEDGRGNLTKEIIHTADLGDAVTTYAYDNPFNKLSLKRDAEGHETHYNVSSSNGDLLSEIDAEGNQTFHSYADGVLTSTTAPGNKTTRFEGPDSFGNPQRITDPAGIQTMRQYDARGRLIGEVDTQGHRRTLSYDAFDRVVMQRRFGGQSPDEITRTNYYPNGETQSVIQADGTTTVFVLDGRNRVTDTIVNGQGLQGTITTHAAYDGNGNKVQETDERGVMRRFVYDELNQLREVRLLSGPPAGDAVVAEPAANTLLASYGYDIVGNKTSETDLASLLTRYDYDGLYRVNKKTLPLAPYVELYVNDKVGNRTSFIDANGHETKYGYDGLHRLTRTENALHEVSTVAYNDPPGSHVNKSEEFDQTRGLRTTFDVYDGKNRERRRTVHLDGAAGQNQQYVTSTDYDDHAHTYTVTDPRLGIAVYQLDGLDHVVSKRVYLDSSHFLETITGYNHRGVVTSVTDPLGHTTGYTPDALGRVILTTDAKGRESHTTFDDGGLVIEQKDRRSVVKKMAYDYLGRLRRTDVLPSRSGVPWSSTITYNDAPPPNLRRTETDARGKDTVFAMDSLRRVTTVTDALGNPLGMGYDGVNKTSETDRRGNTTIFGYDAINRLTLTTDPAPFSSQTVQTVFSDASNKKTVIDRRGLCTETQFDPLGRPVAIKRGACAGAPPVMATTAITIESHSYDGNGNTVLSVDGEGKQTRFEYDPANRLHFKTAGFGSPEAALSSFDYDAAGNLTFEHDARSLQLHLDFSTKREYDELNRMIAETNGLGERTQYGYDEEGNRTSVTLPGMSVSTSYDYDELGKLTRVTQPPAGPGQSAVVTQYTYDNNRNRTAQKMDAGGPTERVVTMHYDDLNRLDFLTQDPGHFSLVTEHRYDENGNERILIDANHQTVTSNYDELNRLRGKTYALAATDTVGVWQQLARAEFDPDPNGNVTQVREYVASGTSPPSATPRVTDRVYDDLDRLQSETTTLPDTGSRATVAYTYFGNGARKTVTDPANALTQYTYDGQNRLQSVKTSDGATTLYKYLLNGLADQIFYPNGVTATHAYDNANRLTGITNAKGATIVSSYTYAYGDGRGNRTQQIETNGGVTETTAYTYDNLDRLATITYPVDASFPNGRRVEYTYDGVGNRVGEKTVNPADSSVLASKTGHFDTLNRLTSLVDDLDATKTSTYSHDNDGNTLSKTVNGSVTTYAYDVRDKQVEVKQDGALIGQYIYDADGRLIKSLDDQGPRQIVYDQTSRLVETGLSGEQLAKYDYGNRLIRLTNSDGARFFHFDGLGSATALTDPAGAVRNAFHLDVFGTLRNPSELDATQNRTLFTGYNYSKSTGLYFANSRWYDSETGRFTSADDFSYVKVDEPPSLNLYVYVRNDPTGRTDPDGHSDLGDAERPKATDVNAPDRGFGNVGSNDLLAGDARRAQNAYYDEENKKHPYQDEPQIVAEDGARALSGTPSAVDDIDAQLDTLRVQKYKTLRTAAQMGKVASVASQVGISVLWSGPDMVLTVAAGTDINGNKVEGFWRALPVGAIAGGIFIRKGGELFRILQKTDSFANDFAKAERIEQETASAVRTAEKVEDEVVNAAKQERTSAKGAEELVTWVDEGGNLRAGGSPGMRPDAYRHQSGAAGARSNLLTGRGQAPYLEFTDKAGNVVGAKFDGVSGMELIDRKLNPVFSPKAVDQAIRQAAVARHYGLNAVWEMPTQQAVDAAKRFMQSNNISGIAVRLRSR